MLHLFVCNIFVLPAFGCRFLNESTTESVTLCFSVYSEVFWKGCLPGSKGNLCKVCVGGTGKAATKRCADHHNERYYGNMGALRWLT